ncbi:MAG: phosphoglycerate kinase [Planctomycetota bacterium]|mgnify:FL=1
MNKLTVSDMDLSGQRVLTRVDFNVPQDKDGNVSDETRIRATVPTLNYILEKHGKLVLMSHLGRPDGKKDDQFKLDKVGAVLEKLLGRPVKKLDEAVGLQIEKTVSKIVNCSG